MRKISLFQFNLILFTFFSLSYTYNCFAAVISLDGSFFVLPSQQYPNNMGNDQNYNDSNMDSSLRTVENRILALINQERNGAGLPTLQRDPGLDRVILWHVNNMATDHFLSHVDKNNRRAEGRADYYSGDSSYRCLEIIQWWGGTPSGDVHYNGYYNSPSHHSAYMEEGIYNLGPTSHAGVSAVAGTGPAGSQYEGRAGSYTAVFLCDRPLDLIIDPFSEN